MQLNETTAYLDGSTFYEVIDPELMRQYALSIHASDYSDWENKYYENEKTHLLKYVESFDKKNKLFRVEYARKKKIGRVNPKASIGAVALARATRNTLMRHSYFDFDIENAHPIILREILSRKYNIKTEFPCLDDYCSRRDELLREIMDAYKIDRKIAKNAFISMMYNGTPESWRKKNSLYFDGYDRKQCLVEKLLDNFTAEIDKVITLFVNANKELYKRECDSYRKNKKNAGKKNERGSFFSTVMQEYELQLTSSVMKWCVENGLATFRDMPNCVVASYAYDGFMLLKENVEKYGGIQKLLDDLSQITFDLTGYHNIVWTNKDMNDEFNDFAYSHRDWSKFTMKKAEDVKQLTVSFSDAYDAIKKEFEKEHFKCLATSCFVQEVVNIQDERNLILRNKSELMVAFSHLRVHYQMKDRHGNVLERETRFIEEWINDEHIRRYDRMDNYPNMEACPENVYNIWIPFRISTVPMPEETEEIKKGVAFLRNHLSIMCNHEEATLQEFENWIAQMIQHPEKKSYMPIFQSDEGAGKGSFAELMRAMLGKSKVFMTSSPDEYVWGRFNNLMETAFLVFMDEINRFMTGSGLDKIKNVVSEPTIQIQHKGKGAYTMNSTHRFAALTNAWDGGLPVNKKSRRFLMCSMSNEKIGDMDYFNKFYKFLEDDQVLRALYEHFATKKNVPKKLPPPIQTEFQKEMSELTVDVPTLWLRDFIGDAKRNKSTLLQMKETSQMYKIINKETKTEFTNGAFVKTEIADSGDYVIELFGKQTFEKIIEWAKKNGYEKYETTPTKIIIYLLRKKWSGLTKGRVTSTGNTIYLFVDALAEMFEL